jgi:hypothetical protein
MARVRRGEKRGGNPGRNGPVVCSYVGTTTTYVLYVSVVTSSVCNFRPEKVRDKQNKTKTKKQEKVRDILGISEDEIKIARNQRQSIDIIIRF